MKKLSFLVITLLLLSVASAQAQVQFITNDYAKEGTRMFSPQLLNLSYQSLSIGDSGDSDNLSQLGLSVSGGYAIMDNLFILGQVAGQSLKMGSGDAAKVSFFSIGAGARYYLGNLFGGAALLVNTGKVGMGGYYDDDMGVGSDDISTTIFGFRAEVGYAWLLTPWIALEPSISYGGKIAGGGLKAGGDKTGAKLKYNQFGINLGVSVFF